MRCVVCGWTINPNRVEIVQRGDDILYLHRGGCPKPRTPENVEEST